MNKPNVGCSKPIFGSCAIGCWLMVGLTGCSPEPPSTRAPITLPSPSGDAALGAKAFKTYCGQCHELTPGLNRRAPNLKGVYGSKAGALGDYEYSEGLKASSMVWDENQLVNYMMNPKQMFPNTKMLVDQFPDQAQAEDIVAFLATQS